MRWALLYSILLFASPSLYCQPVYYNRLYTEGAFTWECSAGLGAMNCLTDLGGTAGGGSTLR